jgi:hypothetical protein
MKKIILAIAILFMAGSPKASAADTGSILLQKCRAAEQTRMTASESSDYSYCVGYITGVLDGLLLNQRTIDEFGKIPTKFICIPAEGIDIDQMVLIVTKFLKDNPEKLHYEAGILIRNAMVKAFPCPKSSNSKK